MLCLIWFEWSFFFYHACCVVKKTNTKTHSLALYNHRDKIPLFTKLSISTFIVMNEPHHCLRYGPRRRTWALLDSFPINIPSNWLQPNHAWTSQVMFEISDEPIPKQSWRPPLDFSINQNKRRGQCCSPLHPCIGLSLGLTRLDRWGFGNWSSRAMWSVLFLVSITKI